MTSVPPPVPKPIDQFDNARLRDSLNAALAGVPPGHSSAVLDVDNKGAGVMVVKRSAAGWDLVSGLRYTFEDRGVAARVQVSW